MRKLGITTAEGATDILPAFFTLKQMLPKTQYIIEETAEQLASIDQTNP
jgi:hypothetical protein